MYQITANRHYCKVIVPSNGPQCKATTYSAQKSWCVLGFWLYHCEIQGEMPSFHDLSGSSLTHSTPAFAALLSGSAVALQHNCTAQIELFWSCGCDGHSPFVRDWKFWMCFTAPGNLRRNTLIMHSVVALGMFKLLRLGSKFLLPAVDEIQLHHLRCARFGEKKPWPKAFIILRGWSSSHESGQQMVTANVE